MLFPGVVRRTVYDALVKENRRLRWQVRDEIQSRADSYVLHEARIAALTEERDALQRQFDERRAPSLGVTNMELLRTVVGAQASMAARPSIQFTNVTVAIPHDQLEVGQRVFVKDLDVFGTIRPWGEQRYVLCEAPMPGYHYAITGKSVLYYAEHCGERAR